MVLGHQANAADILLPVTPSIDQVKTENGWTFEIVPYAWAAGLTGSVGQFGLPPVHVDLPFWEVFDHLDFAGMAVGEARYDRYSLIGDVIYVKLSGQKGTPRGVVANDVSVDSKTFTGFLGGSYYFLDTNSAQLGVMAGARVWSVDTRISFSGGVLDGVSRSDGETWVDATAGLRGSYSLTPQIYLTGWGVVGAGQADLDWDVAGGIGYRFNDKFEAVAGYRALGVDFQDGGFLFDVVMHGPILGLVARF
nr:hypothetical protein [Pseudaminobacter soli]